MSQLAKFRCCDFNYLLAKKKRPFLQGHIKFFGKGQFLGGDIKVFSGRWVEGNKVVCLKTRTLPTCLLGKKSDLVEFFIWGGNFFFGGEVLGGDIEVFSGGDNVLRGKSPESRVQSPESRVQGPVQLLGYANETRYSTESTR